MQAHEAGTLIRIDPTRGPWPLHDTAASRTAEQAALATHPEHPLMARAGAAVARLALAIAPHAQRIVVFAGPGNNGGDGLVAARRLHDAGKTARVVCVGDMTRLPADAAQALQAAQAAGVALSDRLADAAFEPDLAIDALLGLGARRAPEGRLRDAIAAMNDSGAPVLAVDLPSGLHADTGQPLGDVAVRARHTLSLLTLKPGLCTALGGEHAGQLWLDTLGVDAGAPTAWLGGPPASSARALSSHKGSHGDVVVVGGAPGMVGAAWLAARAALAAGAGRVYACLLDERAAMLDAAHPELMARSAWWLSPPAQLAAATVACGCGGGTTVREALPPLLSQVPRLVLDADALNAIAADTMLQTLLRQRASRGLATLLTPHPLEAARLLQSDAAAVQRDRLAAASALAGNLACTVLLKGSGTIIAATGRVPIINPTGNAALATAGTGDVLAGWCAGVWAQAPDSHPADIGTAAAWAHGHAADRWPPAQRGAPLRASALIEELLRRQVD